MASLVYNIAKAAIFDGTLDLDTDTLKVMLVDNSYTANADDNYVDEGASDPLAAEAAFAAAGNASGYVSGSGSSDRKVLSLTVSTDDTNDRAELNSAASTTWSGIDCGTAAAAIVYQDVGLDTVNVLIAYIDSGGFPVVTNGGDFTINWNADGILQIT